MTILPRATSWRVGTRCSATRRAGSPDGAQRRRLSPSRSLHRRAHVQPSSGLPRRAVRVPRRDPPSRPRRKIRRRSHHPCPPCRGDARIVAGPAPKRLSAARGSRALTAATTAASARERGRRACAACVGGRSGAGGDGKRTLLASRVKNGATGGVGRRGYRVGSARGALESAGRVRDAPRRLLASSSPGPCRVATADSLTTG